MRPTTIMTTGNTMLGVEQVVFVEVNTTSSTCNGINCSRRRAGVRREGGVREGEDRSIAPFVYGRGVVGTGVGGSTGLAMGSDSSRDDDGPTGRGMRPTGWERGLSWSGRSTSTRSRPGSWAYFLLLGCGIIGGRRRHWVILSFQIGCGCLG